MLYTLLKWLFYPTVKAYFRSLFVKGRSNIPESGPIIFVANHNSAFMDPIVLGVHIKQAVYFLARGEAFKSRLSSWIFGMLNMIPVYRPEVTPDKMHMNKEVFQRCFEHLQKGKTLMIFPEGFSKTVRNLRPLKTGAARIALGAEDQNDFKLNIKIIPVGINYSDPHTFRSDVFINFGSPFTIAPYQNEYLKNEKETVMLVTSDIEKRLEELLVVVKDEEQDELIMQIETICRNEEERVNGKGVQLKETFDLSRNIAGAAGFYQREQPAIMKELKRSIDRYFKELNMLRISDRQIKPSQSHVPLIPGFLYFVLGAPIFLYGLLVNVLPYATVRLLSAKIRVREDFVGSLKLALGAFLFLIFYVIETVVFASAFTWYWTLLFGLSLYPSGLFTINYIKNYYKLCGDLRFMRLFRKKRKMIAQLQQARDRVMLQIEEMRASYRRHLTDQTP